MLEKFERSIRVWSNWFTGIGVILILAYLGMTFFDIISAKAFHMPVRGSIELAGLHRRLLLPLQPP